MGKGLAAVVHISVGVVVEQYDGLCLAHLAQPVDDVFDLVLQHSLISGYVYLFPSFYIAQQLFAVHALSVPQRLTVFSDGSLQSPHGVVAEERGVYVAPFKHFQSLSDGLHTCGGVARTERHGDAIVGIERTQFYQSVLCLTGHVRQDASGYFLRRVSVFFRFDSMIIMLVG